MLLVGLTGGIASGKSTVSEVWREEGAFVVDADRIARELVQPGRPAWQEILRLFGEEILQADQTLHRKRLAALVFSSKEKREKLNGLLHPRIMEEMDRQIQEIRRKDPEAIVIVDAALLVETGDYRKMDRLVVVQTTETQQIQRLVRRDGITPEEANRIVSAQFPQEEKVKVADVVLRNEGSIEEMRQKTREMFQELKRWALQKKNPNGKRRGHHEH
jgi:dephospho-CoA kinase